MHFLISELGYQDKDLALDAGRGFQTIGTHKVTGVWEVDQAKASPKNQDIKEFYDSLKPLKSMGEKPSWMMDCIIDAVLQAIREDGKVCGDN